MIVNQGIPVEQFEKFFLASLEKISDRIEKLETRLDGKQKDVVTTVAIVMDKSGSMGSVLNSTIDGFNEYIETLKKKDGNYQISLTFFDTEVTTKYTNKPLNSVPKLTGDDYIPDGMTALYDGVGQTITKLDSKVKKDTPVLVVIMTDGGENSSREYDQKKVAKMIKNQEDKGWTFVFIGANQDSWATAQTFGLTSKANVVNFNQTNRGVNAMFRGLGDATAFYSVSASNVVADGGRGAEITTDSFFSDEIKQQIEQTS